MTTQNSFAVIIVIAGLVCALGIGFFIYTNSQIESGRTNITLLVIMGIGALVFSAIGINILLGSRTSADMSAGTRADYRHSYLLFGLIGVILLGAMIARDLAVPDTFGQVGHYRYAAVDEATVFEPQYQGKTVCDDCHPDIVQVHQKDLHASLECELCHGPAAQHVDDPEGKSLDIPDGRSFCLVCHQLLVTRPGDFPQIDWQTHFKAVGVQDLSVQCIQCHSPHEPLFMDRDVRNARLHPLIHRCRDCHLLKTDENQPKPAGHPVIFECTYCHPDTVRDFANRSHASVECTTCHLFSKVNDFSGKIIRDADPRFCLLCHQNAEYRSTSAPAVIDWPDHLDDVMEGPEDSNKRCIDCHSDRIHGFKGDSIEE